MRLPSVHQRKEWHRFFAGAIIGGFVSWAIFIYIHGELQEYQTKTLQFQKDQIQDLTNDIAIWQDEYTKINEQTEKDLLVEDIEVKILNAKKYGILALDSSLVAQDLVKEDLKPLLTKRVLTVYQNRDLVKRVIENKTVVINDRRYSFVVREMFMYTRVQITLELQLAS
ncbi:sporulation membrane protein YtrI [Mangrovibacillus cuniculi]|uniref:Sporulation protein n=1 Tax=Mangrovibacillus cuniculi TaxID=2593652 RepID=A0A7S8CC05_9BACI|nr:sporulation membrane protein YtrI [Mangrovibacillus cuniculi]QPC47215.1 sporulation protein [Mangrovibacillus cuniculi]